MVIRANPPKRSSATVWPSKAGEGVKPPTHEKSSADPALDRPGHSPARREIQSGSRSSRPRDSSALAKAVGKATREIASFAVRQPSVQQKDWESTPPPARMIDATLDMVREMSRKIRREDRVPAPEAAQVAGKRAQGTDAVLSACGFAKARSHDAQIAHALLLMGEVEAEWRHSLGIKDAPAPPIIYRPLYGSKAQTLVDNDDISTARLKFGADALHSKSTGEVRHEATHLMQANFKQAGPPNHDEYVEKEAFHAIEDQARAGSLALARGLPEAPVTSKAAAYGVTPKEAHAFHTQGFLADWLLQRQALNPSTFPKDCGMDLLGPVLARVGRKLNGYSKFKTTVRTVFGQNKVTELHPKSRDDFSGQMARITLVCGQLLDATHSAGWGPDSAAELKGILLAIDQEARSSKGRKMDGSVQLQDIADRLCGFYEKISETKGHLLDTPQGDSVRPAKATRLKEEPVATLQTLVNGLSKPEKTGRKGAPARSRQFAAMDRQLESLKVDCGFRGAVNALKERIEQGTEDEESIQRAIRPLALELMGVPRGHKIPPRVLPPVALENAPDGSLDIPRVEGLNEAGHQRLKAEFEPSSWQFHVPREILKDTGRLEDRLAKLAAKLAWYAVEEMAPPERTGALEWQKPTPFGRDRGLLREVKRDLQSLRETSDRFIGQDPRSPAAALRTLVQATPLTLTGDDWQKGLRRQVKADMNDPAHPDAQQAAQAHRAQEARRWQLNFVAFVRAVGFSPSTAGHPEPDDADTVTRA